MKIRNQKSRIAFFLALILSLINCVPAYSAETNLKDITGKNSILTTSTNVDELDLLEDSGSNESIEPVQEIYNDNTYIVKSFGIAEEYKAVEIRNGNTAILRDSESDNKYGEWNPYMGVKYRISENILYISANDVDFTPVDDRYGIIPSFAPQSSSAWLGEKDEFTQVYLDNSIKKIGLFAFKDCALIESFYIPASVTSIEYGAFISCKQLASFDVESTNPRYCSFPNKNDYNLYEKLDGGKLSLLFAPINMIKDFYIDENTIEIGDYACYKAECYSNTVKIPSRVTKIGQLSFYGCKNVTAYILGDRVNSTLGNEVISSNLISIGSAAFGGNENLKYVFMPDTLENSESVKKDCFGGSESGGVVGDTAALRSKDVDQDTKLEYVFFYSVDPDKNSTEKMDEPLWFPTYVLPKSGVTIQIPYNHNVLTFRSPVDTIQSLTPIVVPFGKKISETDETLYIPEALEGNYVFLKWKYSEADFDENTVVKRDYYNPSLVAKWEPLYDIEFDADRTKGHFDWFDIDGEYAYITSVKISNNKALPLDQWPEPPIPNDKDSRFLGWIVDNTSIIADDPKDPLIASYANKSSKSDYIFDNFKGGKIVLTALYLKNSSLTFWDSENKTSLVISYRNATTLSQGKLDQINEFERDNWTRVYGADESYEFQGWFTNTFGRGKKLELDGVMSDAIKPDYFPYYKKYINVTLDYGFPYNPDGTSKTEYKGKDYKIYSGEPYTLDKIPYREGYKFKGWYPSAERTGTPYASVVPGSVMTGDKTFYAGWQKLCTVTLDRRYEAIYSQEYLNKTENKHLLDKIVYKNITSGNQILYNYTIPYDTVSGDWKFAGWYRDLRDERTRVESTSVINEDMVLYAKWVQGLSVQYVVPIKETSGWFLFWGTVVSPGTTLPLVPDDMGNPDEIEFGYRGYIFDGWLDENGNPPDKRTIVNDDLVYYAQFYDDPFTPNEIQVTVSFNTLGGPEVVSQTVSINTYIEEPDHGTWTDHKFLGWYTDPEFTEEWDFLKNKVTQDMYLYAKWIYWTAEDEAEYQDNLKGIYWVKVVRGEKLSLTQYFKESGLKYTFDSDIVRFNKNKRIVKGKRVGSTLITAKRADGSNYKYGVRVFVVLQELQDMYAFTTNTTINAVEYLTVSGFLPDRWQSSNTKVASIDPKSGIIKVRGRGKSVIKAFYKNKPVKATLYSEVPKFSKPFVIMKTGQTKKLKIKKLKKYDIVSWNVVSQDTLSGGRIKSIGTAEIDDNGRITALTAGDVTVYANVYGQVISCKVHIEPPILSTSSLVLDVNKTKKLKLKRTKLKYVEWTSTDDQIAYVDPVNGTVYALQPGRVILKTTAGGVTNTCSLQVVDPAVAKQKKNNKKK